MGQMGVPVAPWQADKAWSDQFSPVIKHILGTIFIVEAPVIEDQRENTDYFFTVAGRRVAARVRTWTEYYNKSAGLRWGDQWTLRSKRPSGVATELQKILDGWGDYYFYGWGKTPPPAFPAYTIFDLEKVRSWLFRASVQLEHTWFRPDSPWQVRRNADGTEFLVIDISRMPAQTILCRSTPASGTASGFSSMASL